MHIIYAITNLETWGVKQVLPDVDSLDKFLDPKVFPILKRVLSLVIKEVLPTPFEPNKATLNISNDINPISP